MNLARVRGTVVATVHSDKVEGARWLLVEDCDHEGCGQGGVPCGAGHGGGGSGAACAADAGKFLSVDARTEDRPMDTLVVAIVDAIDQGGALTWNGPG